MRRMEPAEMCFILQASGYRMTDHKRSEDIREMGIIRMNNKHCQKNDQTIRKERIKAEFKRCSININRRAEDARGFRQKDGTISIPVPTMTEFNSW
jgi:hypothetical protein